MVRKMSRKFSDRFRFSSVREKLTISRERKTSQSLKVRSTNLTKQKHNSSLPDISAIESTTKLPVYEHGDVQVHILGENTSSVFSEFVQYFGSSTKLWERHHITLGVDEIMSESGTGIFSSSIQYHSIDKVGSMDIEKGPRNCVKMIANGRSLLLQPSDTMCFHQETSPYQRDCLLNTLKWKMEICKSLKTLNSTTQPSEMLSELESLVSLTMGSALLVEDTHRILLDIASKLLTQKADVINEASREDIIMALAPLVENNQPSTEICSFFTKHCRQSPRSTLVVNMFTPIVQQILKHTVDFGKSTWLRTFIMEYIQALNSQNNGLDTVRAFIQTIHGPLSQCPHPRILNSLIAVCLSAVYQYFSCGDYETEKRKHLKKKSVHRKPPLAEKSFAITEKNLLNNQKPPIGDTKNMKNSLQESINNKQANQTPDVKPLNTDHPFRGDVNLKEFHDEKKPLNSEQIEEHTEISEEDFASVKLFTEVLIEISKMYDWRPGLAGLLQPLPFPEEAMKRRDFVRLLYPVIERFAEDDRESVVTCLLYSREGKDGWLQVFSPGGKLCDDDGQLFSKMVEGLMKPGIKAGKMKKFLSRLASTELQVIIMLALRESPVMIQVLRDMLQFGKLANELEQLQVVSTLRCTPLGNKAYEDLRTLLSVFSQNDGPDEFMLAPNSTDEDLRTLLSTGSWGNLKKLDLGYTDVSSNIVDLLVLLPNLKHLNLRSTNMNDVGLKHLCDSAINLQSLDLCETYVTDEAIACLEVMTNLERLNLNSTGVSHQTYLHLRKTLPNLMYCDVTYTEAYLGHI
uniref:C-Maf-inducing protein-like n=1 Tax=Phallusia mammillata TaxID=59560 RepID=A0A6F9DA55_9ASCI|nr:C-Maf-inducing protein-like [Phallusia mammillata]